MIWRIRRWWWRWKYRLTGRRNTLKGVWTLEPTEDLMHLHGFDCKDELSKLITEAIKEEIDTMVLNDLYFREAWTATMPARIAYLKMVEAQP